MIVIPCPFPDESAIYNKAELDKKRKKDSKTASTFDCVYLFQPGDDTQKLFPTWTERNKHKGTVATAHKLESGLINGLPIFNDSESQRFAFAWGIDFSSPKRPGNVLACWSMDAQDVFRPVEFHLFDRINSDIIIDTIESARKRGIEPCTVRPENAGVQGTLVNEIELSAKRHQVEWLYLIESHDTNAKTKWDKETGIMMVDGLVRSGKMEWPESMSMEYGVASTWVRVETDFATSPLRPDRGKGHPDPVMASWFAINGLTSRGHIYTTNNGRGVSTSYSIGEQTEDPF